MAGFDPRQLRSSVMAYRNLPDVKTTDDCYYQMLRVSLGLKDIIEYLDHTIYSFEKKYAALKVQLNNRSVREYVRRNHKNATWARIISVNSDESGNWKKLLQRGISLLSPDEVRNSDPYQERIPLQMPENLKKLLRTKREQFSFLGYPIEILDFHESHNMILLAEVPEAAFGNERKRFRLFYIPSTYQWRRYREALYNFINEPSKNLNPLLNLFQRTSSVKWPDVPSTRFKKSDWLFLKDQDNPSTEKQRRFVRRAVKTPDFALLWGPPGAGKTYTIMELIYQAVRRGMRVLFCASTHVAIDQALERLLTEPKALEEIVPLRIGASEKISSLIRDYQLERIAPHYRKEIVDELSAKSNRSKAQNQWLRTLNSEDGKSWVDRMLVESANLVCGTTVGILQHPEIKGASHSESKPVYDILIIDEASKTTFHEFLVPAHFAQRWILCGDPRQLSPHVDADSIAATIKTLLDNQEQRDCCIDIYSVAKQHRYPIQLLLISDDEIKGNLYNLQAESKGLHTSMLDDDTDLGNKKILTEILSSSVIISDESKAKTISKYLPGSIEMIRGNQSLLGPEFKAKREYLRNQGQLWTPRERNWELELSIILGQEFFTRTTKDGSFEKYGERKQLLIPEFIEADEFGENLQPSTKSAEQFEEQLNRVRLCAYPSVLELLVEGFRPEADFDSTLNRGFPEDALENRLIKLQYQFRMHPEMSSFPRTHIYDSELLRDAPNVESKRSWPYQRYTERAIWMDVTGDCENYTNKDEAHALVKELKEFLDWAALNPRPDGERWEVAVLSFYNNQIDCILQLIQSDNTLTYDKSDLYTAVNAQIRIGSVDSIQGREADIVFISFVRNGYSGIGFLNSPNRLNVAITRGRYQLVLVGNKRGLAEQNESELLRRLAELPDDTPFGDDEE